MVMLIEESSNTQVTLHSRKLEPKRFGHRADVGSFGRFSVYKLKTFGATQSSRSWMWNADLERDGLALGTRSVNEVRRWDSADDGLPFHGLSELALSRELSKCQLQPCPFAQVSESVVDHGTLFIAYQQHFVQDLDGHLKMNKHRGEPTDVPRLTRQMFVGLEYMHARGILHRNLKPSYLLLDSRGSLVISGFAYACRESIDHDARPMTAEIAPIVLPPEQLLGEFRSSRSADIWAAGIVLAYVGRNGLSPFDSQGCEIGLIFSIFQLLGTPQSPHPLTLLPYFKESWPQWKCRGWESSDLQLSANGVQLLTSLTNLDPCQRASASEVLRHPYFAPGDMEASTSCAAAAQEDAWNRSSMAPASSTDAYRIYLDEELKCERAAEVRRLMMAKAVRNLLGSRGRNDICELVWSFLFQPYQPEDTVTRHMTVLQRLHRGAEPPSQETVRMLMMDWLTATCDILKVEPQVLHSASRVADQGFLSGGFSISSDEYQALVVAAMFFIMKMERQGVTGQAGLLRHITHSDEDVMQQVLMFEQRLAGSASAVQGLDAYRFLKSFARDLGLQQRCVALAWYFLDRSLLSLSLSRHCPSLLAAAACSLAMAEFKKRPSKLGSPFSSHGSDSSVSDVSCFCGRSMHVVQAVASEFKEVADPSSMPQCTAANRKHADAVSLLQGVSPDL